MKKSLTIIIALAMILGMSQCKKKTETIPVADEFVKGVYITLNIVEGDRHIVHTDTGAVDYTDDDVIYVGNDGKYCGLLTCDEGQFCGTIYPTNTNDYLHFYFVGGSTPSATPEVGTTTSFTVNISDQSSNLPVLSYAKSTEKYTEGLSVYESFLLNKCGLVEFVLTDGTSESVTVANLQTEATISFANPDNAIVATGTTGAITLKSQSETSKWAILLPTSAATSTTATIAGNNYDVDIPVINYNDYLHNSTAVEVDNATPAVDYVFTVDSNGTTVHFAPGNLQYNAATAQWRFAENQWDICQTENGDWDMTGWVDLFGWGTWGEIQNPLMTATFTQYNYELSNTDFQGTLDGYNDWFTLSKDQWQYITDHGHWGFATITVGGNDINGTIILPDDSSLIIDETHDSWSDNTYTDVAWTDNMKSYGAVFLPNAGDRYLEEVMNAGSYGAYWSSSLYVGGSGASNYVPSVNFDVTNEPPCYYQNDFLDDGLSVRLVR